MKATPDNMTQAVKEAVEVTDEPDFRHLHPKYVEFRNRMYELPGSAHSFNLMRDMIGLHLYAGHTAAMLNTNRVNSGVLMGLVALAAERYDFPWWYVPANFVEVAKNVTPPTYWQVNEVPFPAFYFLLPKGALTGDEGEDISFIGVNVGKTLGLDKALIITAHDPQGTFWRNVQRIDENNIVKPKYTFNPNNDSGETNSPWVTDVLMPFTMTLLGIMSARPELVGTSTRERTIKKSGKEVWTPRILGAKYRTHTSRGSTGDEPSYHVRTHWRKGHLRSQHYGPKNSLIRQVFIDPVLVNPA